MSKTPEEMIEIMQRAKKAGTLAFEGVQKAELKPLKLEAREDLILEALTRTNTLLLEIKRILLGESI